MGLTKRLDYNGRLAELGEDLYTNFTGGAKIATRKLNLKGPDDTFIIDNDSPAFEGNKFGAPYAVEDDPNHTHYYIWRWFAQLSLVSMNAYTTRLLERKTTTSSF